ncbi:MAG: SCO family protein [Caldilinea sp.]
MTPSKGSADAVHVETPSNAPAREGHGWRTYRFLVALAAVIVVGAVAFLLWQRFGPRPGPKYGVAINANAPVQDFRLNSTLGHPLALSDFADRYTVLYFGYTTCPDICPTTLADLGKAEKLLGDTAKRMQVFFVTVDPERDTSERLHDYLAYFSPTFIGLSGGLEETEAVASQFGVVYEKRYASGSATDYLMDHSAAVIVLDPERRPQVMFPFGVTAEQIASDLQALLR